MQTSKEILQEIKDFREKTKSNSVSTTHIYTFNEWRKIADKILDIYSEIRVVKKVVDAIPRAFRIAGYNGRYVELTISN